MYEIKVLDSFIAYTETTAADGDGPPPVVFLHGNPTSSHLWRNVIPHVAGGARIRTLAPDLIGMGASGKPDIGYRFADHARYLDAWFEEMGLDDGYVIVGHDWGGALGMDHAARHPGRVKGIALLETLLRPQRWEDWPPQGRELFQAFRKPGVGEEMILEQNIFIEQLLPSPFSTQQGMAEADLAAFRAPYPDPASRKPLLAWPREFPFDGEPADVVERFEAYGRWLADSTEVPKLLMAVDDGVGIGSPAEIEWAAGHAANLTVEGIGPAGHHAPEDQPDAIGGAVARWLEREWGQD
ncbi:haloalkane dehalogenase [Streptomyces sp. A7024]|uniref:Haloalkane dehalogenase n=1 Tax=Streptomyces coryli TaxID=1128680 RepID=A0A6G4U9T5_9ACTN|nr:haloalkane dehalogenase [Streptomyces coryli]NGN69005.1 haloalkane dehalogenase [Streptomyces coryli]